MKFIMQAVQIHVESSYLQQQEEKQHNNGLHWLMITFDQLMQFDWNLDIR